MNHESNSQPDERPLLVNDHGACSMLGCSRAHLHRLRANGKLPEAVRIGNKLQWRRAELEAWVEAGAPDLATWRAMVSADRRRQRA